MSMSRVILRLGWGGSAVILLLLLSLIAPGANGRAPRPAIAATTFTVNSTLDTPDTAIDGVCDDGAGHCTLRAAIMEANAGAPGAVITFAISGGTFQVIAPTSPLPAISTPMTIDATTQSGSGVVGVEVTGASCTPGCSDGFQVTSGSATLKALKYELARKRHSGAWAQRR